MSTDELVEMGRFFAGMIRQRKLGVLCDREDCPRCRRVRMMLMTPMPLGFVIFFDPYIDCVATGINGFDHSEPEVGLVDVVRKARRA